MRACRPLLWVSGTSCAPTKHPPPAGWSILGPARRAIRPASTEPGSLACAFANFSRFSRVAWDRAECAQKRPRRGNARALGEFRSWCALLRRKVALRASTESRVLLAAQDPPRESQPSERIAEASAQSLDLLCRRSKRRRPARRTARPRRIKRPNRSESFKSHTAGRVTGVDWIDGSPRAASQEFGFLSSDSGTQIPGTSVVQRSTISASLHRTSPPHDAIHRIAQFSSSSVRCTLDMSFVRATVLGARVLASMPRTEGELLTRRTFSNFALSSRSDGRMWDSAGGQYLVLVVHARGAQRCARPLDQRVRGPASGCASIVSRY